MENKADVRAIMARFQANGSTSEEAPSASAGHPKQPLHPTLSGQALHMKRPVSDHPPGSGASVPPKPSFLKNSPLSNSDPVVQDLNRTKALANVFTNSQGEVNKPFLKHKSQSKPSFSQITEPKAPLNKPFAMGPDPKPAPSKPTVISTKPSWVKEDSIPSASPSGPKIPPVMLKPNNSFYKLQQQIEGKAEVITDTANKPTLPVNVATKPTNFRTAQNLFNKDPPEQPDCGVKPSVVNKLPTNVSNNILPPKPHPSKKPSMKKPSPHIIDDNPSAPKRNPLPNSLALGPAPAKPNRPPKVNLEVFKKESETQAEVPGKTITPPSHPSNHSNRVTPAPPAVPSLPPRHPGAINQTEETEDFYDDVDGLTTVPPPLPPVHPSQMSKGKDESDDEDGEMYEDLDERWDAAEQKREKKKEKDDKAEKKRLEADKKEQREREKKEQEAKKKFKLVGPIDVLQRGKVRVDFKGNKSDLSLKQGDSLDIIRIQGNPEGKWLGRTEDGSIGYVQISLVDIDYNALKQQEVYDDVDMAPAEQSITKGGRVVLPPLPGDGEDIYDDVDSSQDVRLPTPSPFSRDSGRIQSTTSTDHMGGDIDEEVYDDVDTQTTFSIPKIDPKKQKKFEKEEKEFRKKFKFEGEIKVQHQVTIIPNLTNKKWSSKELPLKSGEKLDVIVRAVDNKFICRNEDGKFGYVSTSYVVTDDGDIYDDIGDDCIYDND